jgi:glycosyltransferase involved in cell wall biosynthesis
MSSETEIPKHSHAIVITEIEAMGGAERSCLALARWLYEHGMPVHFVTYQDKVGLEEFASHPLSVVQLKPQMDARHKIAAMKAYFEGQSEAPKPLMSGYQPALHASLAGIRGFHCLMHDTPSLFSDANRKQSLKQKIGRMISNRTVSRGLKTGGTTFVTSEYLKSETKKVFGVDAVIARMGGMSQEGVFRLRQVRDKLRMLSVSRIEANKRIDWMIRALASLEKESTPLSSRIDWQLDVAGKGSRLEEMRSLAAGLGVGDRILFHGFVSDDELDGLYDQTHLFVMPAVQGYGIPAIESFSRGIPVMLHRESGVSDILLNTPWATVMEGGEEALIPALERAMRQVMEGVHLKTPLPELPTEEAWAARIAKYCGWV